MMLIVCRYFKRYLSYKTLFILLASCVIIYLLVSHYSLIVNIHFTSDDGKMQQVTNMHQQLIMQNQTVHLVVLFSKANKALEKKFAAFVQSLFAHASVPVMLHLVGDDVSHEIAKKHVREQSNYKMKFYNLLKLAEPLRAQLQHLQKYFSYKDGSYYSDPLFFISTVLHRLFPAHDKILMIDIDTKFLDDINKLYQHFDKFTENALIGVAYEQQPVYRHVFQLHRQEHANTTVGDPPPGFPGFNSGVLLLNLERMRKSVIYNRVLEAPILEELLLRYSFKGHLGDQDFFTLVAVEFPELFYVLPCGWNRQLCDWWRRHGYSDVFDGFHECRGAVWLLHGNCNTEMVVEGG
uniref:Xyloside xylosyltransferase 1 n=1 Tax=Strigamia maritima TaxID=126957 RepID=T1IRV4_STRMM